jgi:branched-chain amino acid transport system substrate-binding protein
MATFRSLQALRSNQAMAAHVAMAFCCCMLICGSARADIVIGVAIPAQGVKASYGATLLAAAQTQATRMSATGDLGKVTLAVEDDQCSSAGGADVAARLVAKQVAMVIGHPCSNAAIAAAGVYARAGIAFVALGARHPDVTAKRSGSTVFRLGGRDDGQATDTAKFIQDGAPSGKTAIIHDGTVYARRLADGVAASLRRGSGAQLSFHALVAGEKDYAAVVARVLATRPDTVYFAGFPIEGAIVLKQLRDAGSAARFIGCDALNDPAFATSAGISANGVDVVASALELDGGALVVRALQAFEAAARLSPANPSISLRPALKVDAAGDGPDASFELRKLGPPAGAAGLR